MSLFPDKSEHSLTQKAILTFLSQLLVQGAGVIAGLVFTPLIIRGLGQEMYGAWGVIQKSTGFMGLSNLNAMTALKLNIGVRQHNMDYGEKRRLIGAGVLQWLLLLPIMLIACCVMVYFAPRFVKVAPEYISAVRWTLAIMAVSIPLGQLFSVPGAVLSGQNLEYKAMGLNATVVLIGGLLNVVGLLAGYGIVVLAITTLIGILGANTVRLNVARKNISWFGLEWPSKAELKRFTGLSVFASLSSFTVLLLTSADSILMGTLLGPSTVAVYMTTGALMRFTTNPLQQLLRSGNAGIGLLVGQKNWGKIESLRIEMQQIAFMGLTVIGSVTVLLNDSFLQLWVGKGYYGGTLLTLLIVLNTFIWQLVCLDAIPLDALLKIRPKVIVMFVWGIIGLTTAVLMVPIMGSAAFPLCLSLSNLGIYISQHYLIRRYSGLRTAIHVKALIRPLITTMILFAVIVSIAEWEFFHCVHWVEISLKSALIAALTTSGYFFLGISPHVRRRLITRIRPVILKIFGV